MKDTDPFHAVGRRDLTEHRAVVEDSRVRSIRELVVVRRGTEGKLALALGKAVELDTGRAASGRARRRRWGPARGNGGGRRRGGCGRRRQRVRLGEDVSDQARRSRVSRRTAGRHWE